MKETSGCLALRLRLEANVGLKCLVNFSTLFISRGSHSKTEYQPWFVKSNLQLLFCVRVLLSLTDTAN